MLLHSESAKLMAERKREIEKAYHLAESPMPDERIPEQQQSPLLSKD